MSLFFRYFKNTLKWWFIQTAGPLAALVHGGARVMDQVREDILWLRLQAFPDTCDDQFVYIHGQARGIYQRRNETLAKFRTRVIRAFAWQLLGGKNAGLPRILDYYGYKDVSIYNMREEDPERWAEFKLKLPRAGAAGLSEEDIRAIDDMANDQKPARSKLAAIVIENMSGGSVASGGAVRTGGKISIVTTSDAQIRDSSRIIGGAVRTGGRIRVLVYAFALNIDNDMPVYRGLVVRLAHKFKIGAR